MGNSHKDPRERQRECGDTGEELAKRDTKMGWEMGINGPKTVGWDGWKWAQKWGLGLVQMDPKWTQNGLWDWYRWTPKRGVGWMERGSKIGSGIGPYGPQMVGWDGMDGNGPKMGVGWMGLGGGLGREGAEAVL